MHMRVTLCLFVFASIGFSFSGADSNPYLKLSEFRKDGKVRLVAQNIAGKPIIAYVIAVVRRKGGHDEQTNVYSGAYTGKDTLASGKSIDLAEWDTRLMSSSPTPNIFVDYVRLADGTTWGNSATARGKEVAAQFKN
jgi:hypothetical protein